jgi:hypothetical protein
MPRQFSFFNLTRGRVMDKGRWTCREGQKHTPFIYCNFHVWQQIMCMPKRILVRNHGPARDNAIRALAVATKCAIEAGVGLIHLIVPAKSSFSGSVISEIIGDLPTNRLLRGDTVAIQKGIAIKLESAGTAGKSGEVNIALAAYLSGKDLRQIDSLNHVESIIFLPWMSEEGEGWQESWNAEVLGEKWKENDLELPPELEAELRSLSVRVNLSTGLSHPLDLKAAKEMFRGLNEAAVSYEPNKVRSWALRNGWRPDFAEDLYDLAVKSQIN